LFCLVKHDTGRGANPGMGTKNAEQWEQTLHEEGVEIRKSI